MVNALNNHYIITARAPHKANEVYFLEAQFLFNGYSLRRRLQNFVNKKYIKNIPNL